MSTHLVAICAECGDPILKGEPCVSFKMAGRAEWKYYHNRFRGTPLEPQSCDCWDRFLLAHPTIRVMEAFPFPTSPN
jgi:hypothetical protein